MFLGYKLYFLSNLSHINLLSQIIILIFLILYNILWYSVSTERPVCFLENPQAYTLQLSLNSYSTIHLECFAVLLCLSLVTGLSTVVQCPVPEPAPANTQPLTPQLLMSTTYHWNDTIEYTCQYGYEPLNNWTTITCQADKTWGPWNITCQGMALPVLQHHTVF